MSCEEKACYDESIGYRGEGFGFYLIIVNSAIESR